MESTSPSFYIFPRDTGDTSCNRSTWGIAWTCLLTFFACTWVAIHPNAASEREEAKVVTVRRVGLMIAMFLFPEMVICWALRQSLLATYYAKLYKQNPSGIEWTKNHGFFIIMGGFTYRNDNGKLEILTAKKMEQLYDEEKIDWPSVTATQIRDRSKADPLGKFIVIGQTIWFCLQIVARLAMGLVVTELEISTFAFASLNLIVYVLWWHKPYDVRSHIFVPRKDVSKVAEATLVTKARQKRTREDEILPLTLRSYIIQRLRDIIGTVGGWGRSLQHFISWLWNKLRCRPPPIKPVKEIGTIDWWSYLCGKIGNMVTKLAEAWKQMDGIQDFFALYLAVLYGLFGAPFVSHYVEKGLSTGDTSGSDRYNTPEARARHPLCGWLFFFSAQLFVVGLIGGIFGGVHLVAWVFRFPTIAEMWLWRASSLALAIPPLLLILRAAITSCFKFNMNVEGRTQDVLMWAGMIFMLICAASYMIGRGIIAFLPLIALRNVQPGAFVNIRWASLIPHI